MSTTLTELDEQIARLLEQKQKMIAEQRPAELEKVKDLIRTFGFTPEELGIKVVRERKPRESKSGKGRAAGASGHPVYVNPKDRSMTWSGGRGQKPKWLRDYLESGGTLEAILQK